MKSRLNLVFRQKTMVIYQKSKTGSYYWKDQYSPWEFGPFNTVEDAKKDYNRIISLFKGRHINEYN